MEAGEVQTDKSGSGNAALTVNQTLWARHPDQESWITKATLLNDIRVTGPGRVVKK